LNGQDRLEIFSQITRSFIQFYPQVDPIDGVLKTSPNCLQLNARRFFPAIDDLFIQHGAARPGCMNTPRNPFQNLFQSNSFQICFRVLEKMEKENPKILKAFVDQFNQRGFGYQRKRLPRFDSHKSDQEEKDWLGVYSLYGGWRVRNYSRKKPPCGYGGLEDQILHPLALVVGEMGRYYPHALICGVIVLFVGNALGLSIPLGVFNTGKNGVVLGTIHLLSAVRVVHAFHMSESFVQAIHEAISFVAKEFYAAHPASHRHNPHNLKPQVNLVYDKEVVELFARVNETDDSRLSRRSHDEQARVQAMREAIRVQRKLHYHVDKLLSVFFSFE